METQTFIQTDWREKLRLEFIANGMGSMLDLASKRIQDLENALENERDTVRQVIAYMEASK